MIEIKFRAWDKYRGENGLMLHNHTFKSIAHTGLHMYDDIVWMQYTGLKDKNGVEIYEGDIIGIPYVTPFGDITEDYDERHIVEFKNGVFGFNFETHFKSLDSFIRLSKGDYISNKGNINIYENFIGIVVGNIYENPELL